jgi:hypothetical protein
MMHHLHCKIELLGFDQFNKTCDAMGQKKGKWKNFRKPAPVASISELREVSDRQILWVLEGMNLIDNNEHTRLEHCLDLRIQSSHPGDAPIKEANLVAFVSDVAEIVLKNPKLAL